MVALLLPTSNSNRSSFARHRNITDFYIKVRTVTTSVDASLKDNLPGREGALQKMHTDARVLGILRHLMSIYLNVLVEDPVAGAAGREIIFDSQVFVSHLYAALWQHSAKIEQEKSAKD